MMMRMMIEICRSMDPHRKRLTREIDRLSSTRNIAVDSALSAKTYLRNEMCNFIDLFFTQFLISDEEVLDAPKFVLGES